MDILHLKQKEEAIAVLQNEFARQTYYGSCFIVAGVLHKHLGGKVVEGHFKGMIHWWLEVDGVIYDFNCLDNNGNEFVYGNKDGYEKDLEIMGYENLKKEVYSQLLLPTEEYDYWAEKFEKVLLK